MDSLVPYNPFENKKKSAPYTQEQVDFIKQLIDQGWSPTRIASEYNISKESIKKRIKNNNWSAVKNRRDGSLTNQELKEIKDMVDKGIDYEVIADKYSISTATIYNRVINNKWERQGKKKVYTFNEEYFDNIDNEHKAYWLGFLMADGYILSKRIRKGHGNEAQSFGFAISTKDNELFKYFKEDLEATNPINIYKSKGSCNTFSECGRILLTSQHTVDALKKWGIVENKTFHTSIPNIERRLIKHFIRGYSDGDGSITIDRNSRVCWGLCGTKELLTQIQNYFGSNYKLYQRFPERNNNNWTLHITGVKNLQTYLYIIYSEATIYLKRKYNKYVEIRGIKR